MLSKLFKKFKKQKKYGFVSGALEIEQAEGGQGATVTGNTFITGTNATTEPVIWHTIRPEDQPRDGNEVSHKTKDERIEKKPVEIFKEILVETPEVNLENLDIMQSCYRKIGVS